MLISFINTIVIVAGFSVAITWANAETMRRTGAVVSAISGLFVIWQVREEMQMERKLHAVAEIPEEGPDTDHMLPALERTAQRLQSAERKRQAAEVRQSRLRLVGIIALWLCIGEMLHGFGDILIDGSLELSAMVPPHLKTL